MSIIRTLPDGKSQIIKDIAFCELLDSQMPKEDLPFSTLFDAFDQRLKSEDPKITTGALNNVHGDWYEWLLAIMAWNHFSKVDNAHLAILLPNISQFDVSTLYEQRLSDLIADLKRKVSDVSEVQLITSNPDFVIINNELARNILGNVSEITLIQPENLKMIEEIYQNFIGQCKYEQIEGYISVKNTLRPDRRLQISHEGSLMKALYAHLQTREWITKPKGLKYYAIASKVGESDRNALKTVATHSLTTVFSLPQAAVDEVFEVSTLQEAESAFSLILS